ncbi:hypothetical protein GCM10011533_22270 [Streptosporangium jomthongense]|nr:hypothetical protein GCM10011533_22270 [Streptosporangium jomthongense]
MIPVRGAQGHRHPYAYPGILIDFAPFILPKRFSDPSLGNPFFHAIVLPAGYLKLW